MGKTIYFVWNYLEWGGAQIYFLALMRNLAQNFEVKAVIPKDSDRKIISYLEQSNLKYDFYDSSVNLSEARTLREKIQYRFENFISNLKLARHLSGYDLKNSIVHIDVAPWSAMTLLVYLTIKTRVFITFHTALPNFSKYRRISLQLKFLFLTLFKNFRLAASNLDVKTSLRSFVSEDYYKEIEVIYSSINVAEIEETKSKAKFELADKYNFPSDKIWICNVGQFIDRKGCWVLLDAIKSLQKIRKDLFFFWLGTLPLNNSTAQEIGNYQLQDSFRFLSANEIGASRNDLLTLWKAADIFVLPSLQEGLPVALIEAMALGKSCIASEINAIPEAVKNYETGILVKAGESRELAKTVDKLASDTTLQKKIGENARKFALANFDEKIISQKMKLLYEKAFNM